MPMLRPPALLTLLLLLLAPQAQALKVMVVDAELQSTLGYGETTGNRLNLQLVGNYSGPVVLLFAQTDAEKKAGLFPGLQSRYDGTLRGGVLTVNDASAGRSGYTQNAANSPVTLDKFLKTFKLSLGSVTTPSLTLPGLKSTPADNAKNDKK